MKQYIEAKYIEQFATFKCTIETSEGYFCSGSGNTLSQALRSLANDVAGHNFAFTLTGFNYASSRLLVSENGQVQA